MKDFSVKDVAKIGLLWLGVDPTNVKMMQLKAAEAEAKAADNYVKTLESLEHVTAEEVASLHNSDDANDFINTVLKNLGSQK